MRTSLAALAFIFSATAALAQSPPSLTIDLGFDVSSDEVRPRPNVGGISHRQLHVVLSNGNKVSESRLDQYSQWSRNGFTNTSLGGGDSVIAWHVLSSKKLIRFGQGPQHTSIMIVTITNYNHCQLEVKFILMPGFTEYQFITLTHNEVGYFTNVKTLNNTCTIR